MEALTNDINIINCNQLFDQLINFIDLKIFQIRKYVQRLYVLTSTTFLGIKILYAQ